MYEHTTQLRVRYAETDQMGFVYYGHYATYFEIGRVEAMRHLGLSYKELENAGFLMPVLENYSQFHLPAYYDEILTIKVSIPKLPGARINFDYEIYNEEARLIHSGNTVLAFVNKENGRPVKAPEQMMNVLRPYFHD